MKAEAINTNEQQSVQPQIQPPVQPQPIPEKLNQQQALQVLVDAAKISQSKGIFSLDDAELVNKAIKAFMTPAPTGPVPSNG